MPKVRVNTTRIGKSVKLLLCAQFSPVSRRVIPAFSNLAFWLGANAKVAKSRLYNIEVAKFLFHG